MPKYWKQGDESTVVDLASASTTDLLNPSDVGTEQRLKNSGYTIYDDTANKSSSLPSLDNSSAVISPGADLLNTQKSRESDLDTADKLADATASYEETLKSLTDRSAYAETKEGKTASEKVAAAAEAEGTITAEDTAAIEEAGRATGAEYQTQVSALEEKARQGRASNLVAAAKSGGLDASAWAGISALVGLPAGGPEGFEGVGGKLAAMGSEYDAAIADMKNQQLSAVAAAKTAKKQAIITGKEEDYNKALTLYNNAKGIYDDVTTMQQNKATVLKSYRDYLETTSEENKIKIANQVATNLSLGISATDYSEDDKRSAETALGLPAGYFDTYYEAQQAATEAIQVTDEIEKESKIIDAQIKVVKLLLDIPEDQTIIIGDNTYSGLKTIDDKSKTYEFTETDRSGNVTQVVTRINETGELEVVGQLNLGKIGKPMASSGSTNPTNSTFNEKQAIADMTKQLGTVVGNDGFISPDDYTKARVKWIEEGGSATTFDTKFAGYRNPNNPNYVTEKQKTSDRAI